MSPADTDVFPADWLFTNPVDAGFDVTTVRLEDLFDAWVFAARDAELALAAWAVSLCGDRADAFAAYRAALEREERAAAVLKAGASLDARLECPER
jgi:hypothetical protein